MPPSDSLVRRIAFVEGRVQGVGFRETTLEVATILELRGWVRHLVDGRVQVHVEGPEGDVLKLIAWLWTGAPSARVRHVTVTGRPPSPPDQPLGPFAIIDTSRTP